MKFLLTSAGIKNFSIHNALVEVLGKPIADSSAPSVFLLRSTPSPVVLQWLTG